MLKKALITKADLLLILSLLILSLLSLWILVGKEDKAGERRISVQVEGKEIDSIKLSKENIGKSFKYSTKFGNNVLHLTKEGVIMEKSDCANQICVHQGEIKRTGSVIVCLPNHFLVEIKSSEDSSDDIDAVIR